MCPIHRACSARACALRSVDGFTTDPTNGLFNGRSHYQRLRRLVHLLSYVFNSSTILLPNAPFRIYWDVILDPRSDLAAAAAALAPSAAAAAAALAPSARAAAPAWCALWPIASMRDAHSRPIYLSQVMIVMFVLFNTLVIPIDVVRHRRWNRVVAGPYVCLLRLIRSALAGWLARVRACVRAHRYRAAR
jgi:hypothetical protein